jgi:phosphate transport system permease protein
LKETITSRSVTRRIPKLRSLSFFWQSGGGGEKRRRLDRRASSTFFLITLLPIILLVAVIAALTVRAWPITQSAGIGTLITGSTWKPQQGQFGFLPFIAGTFWVTGMALVLAVPPCLLCAVYLSEYSRPRTAAMVKPFLDLLAGIPSVVYGVWGVVAIVPWVARIKPLSERYLGFIPLFRSENPTGYSILAGGIVLAVMIAPFIIAITYEVLRAVPDGAREASLAVGATRWQTVRYAVLPHTETGIFAGIVLGASRALGETMAVLMVVGNVVKVPASIFDPAYPLPALIANNYGEMMSIPMYDAALLGAALVLLLIVLFFNLVSTMVLRRIVKRVSI